MDLLTVSEASELLRVPEATLRYWRHTGDQGPRSFRVGRRVMFKRADCLEWLEKQYKTTSTRPVA